MNVVGFARLRRCFLTGIVPPLAGRSSADVAPMQGPVGGLAKADITAWLASRAP